MEAPTQSPDSAQSAGAYLGAPIITEELLASVRASREDAEHLRQVPSALAETLAGAGLLQMFLPRAAGGPELPPLTAFQAIESISKTDGSIGWCTMLATLFSGFMGWLPPAVAKSLAGDPPDLRLAGSIRPQGRARPTDGGHRISGHWDFASGINHARWLACPCVVMDGDKPALNATGVPRTRTFWVSAANATIIDTWRVMGMRGTGSHDFTVDDLFVADVLSSSIADQPYDDGLLYDPRLFLTWAWTTTVANALGIARGAMDSFIELASVKATTTSTVVLRDRPYVQARVGEAEAILSAARAYVWDSVGTLWSKGERGDSDLDAAILQARLAITHGMHEAARSVDIVFHAAGTNAVYTKNPIERYFRDVHVALQHGAALHSHIEAAGKALLGVRPSEPGW